MCSLGGKCLPQFRSLCAEAALGKAQTLEEEEEEEERTGGFKAWAYIPRGFAESESERARARKRGRQCSRHTQKQDADEPTPPKSLPEDLECTGFFIAGM